MTMSDLLVLALSAGGVPAVVENEGHDFRFGSMLDHSMT
jgi:hypothetical protein